MSKLVKKASAISKADRVLGAIFGLIVAFGIVSVFSEGVRVVATVMSYIDPSTSIFDTVENTVLFKYFF